MQNQQAEVVATTFDAQQARALRFDDLSPRAQKLLLEVYAKLIEVGRVYLAEQQREAVGE